MPAESFALTCNLDDFKSKIDRNLFFFLVVLGGGWIFLKSSPVSFSPFSSYFSCTCMPFSGCSALHGVKPSYKLMFPLNSSSYKVAIIGVFMFRQVIKLPNCGQIENEKGVV